MDVLFIHRFEKIVIITFQVNTRNLEQCMTQNNFSSLRPVIGGHIANISYYIIIALSTGLHSYSIHCSENHSVCHIQASYCKNFGFRIINNMSNEIDIVIHVKVYFVRTESIFQHIKDSSAFCKTFISLVLFQQRC